MTLLALFVSAMAAEPTVEKKFTGYALPSFAWDTDDGLGFGGSGEVAWLEEGYAPYRLSIMAAAYATTNGYHHHRIVIDRVGLGPKRRTRLLFYVAWRQWLNEGYWGIGPGTVQERGFLGQHERDDPDRRRYRHQLYQPFFQLTVRHKLNAARTLEVFGSISPRWSFVGLYPGSLLEEQQPFGVAGGPSLTVGVGLLHDTRKPEIAPRQGHILDVSARGTPDLGGEAGGYGGPLVSFSGFVPLGSRVVFATRVLGEWLFGTVPFYEMIQWGGAQPVSGLGGFQTVRGLRYGRIRGPGKAVANVELRTRVATVTLFSRSLTFEAAPYVDVGAVWGSDDRGPAQVPAYPAAGFGGRVIFDKTFVGRLDTGFGYDPILEADGSITPSATWGFYLAFDHPF